MKRVLAWIIAISSASLMAHDTSEVLFNAAIHKAKLSCGIKSLRRAIATLKSSLDAQIQHIDESTRAFIHELSNSDAFGTYITRSVERVPFTDAHEPTLANKYEQILYEVLGEHAFYRGAIKMGSFFGTMSGRFADIRTYNKSVLKQLVAQNMDTTRNKVVLDVDGGSTAQLKAAIFTHKHLIQTTEWHVSMQYESGHHFLSVVKYGSNHAPITFLVDTYHGCTYSIGEHLLIDAHFDLQNLGGNQEITNVVDYNCHLYTFELTKAAIRYLQENDLKQLEQACIDQDYVRATKLLHDGMKQYLPYYDYKDGVYVRKSRAEIEKHHRNLRWQVSGKVLMNALKKIPLQPKTTMA